MCAADSGAAQAGEDVTPKRKLSEQGWPRGTRDFEFSNFFGFNLTLRGPGRGPLVVRPEVALLR